MGLLLLLKKNMFNSKEKNNVCLSHVSLGLLQYVGFIFPYFIRNCDRSIRIVIRSSHQSVLPTSSAEAVITELDFFVTNVNNTSTMCNETPNVWFFSYSNQKIFNLMDIKFINYIQLEFQMF